MRFSAYALLVFVTFCVLLMLALSAGSPSVHIAEAAVTILIAIGIGGLVFRRGQRNH